MSLFSKLNPNAFSHLTTAEALDAEAETWGRLARKSAVDGHDMSAQYARDARAAAQDKARRLRGGR